MFGPGNFFPGLLTKSLYSDTIKHSLAINFWLEALTRIVSEKKNSHQKKRAKVVSSLKVNSSEEQPFFS